MKKSIKPSQLPKAFSVRYGTETGSAFLVFYNGSVWLLTCAHLFTGEAQIPEDTTAFNAGYVQVTGSNLRVELFKNGLQNFNIVRKGGQKTCFDVIAVHLDPLQVRQFSKFGRFHITQFPQAAVGDEVVAVGFTGANETSATKTVLKGVVEQVEGVSIRLSFASTPGMSGGYLASQAGLLGIVRGNHWSESIATSALALSIAVLEPALFTPVPAAQH